MCHTKLGAPGLYFVQEDVHLVGIKIGRMPGFPVCRFLPGDEVGLRHLFAAEIGFFEVALNPVWSGVCAAGVNQVFADFSQPHVKK